ncbi:hypothetical protein LguiA_022294 [Lonicera macranthoides]
MNKEGALSNSEVTTKPKLYWTLDQDTKLVECLQELTIGGYWKVDTGFRTGYLQEVEKMLEEKLPGCCLKASPNIESRVKTLKRQTMAIAQMLTQSGFTWDDEGCQVKADYVAFKTWCQAHKDAKGLRNKYFPHYNALIEIYGKDRATGEGAIDPIGEEDIIRANIHNISENDDDINTSEGIEVSSTENHHTSSTSRTKGRKRAKTSDGYSSSLGEIATSFKTFVQSTNENIDKLANAICMNHETELGKKVVESLKSIDGLTRADVIKAASMIIGDTPKCSLFLALEPSDDKLSWVRELIGRK